MGATKTVLIKLNDAIVEVVGYYTNGYIGNRENPPEDSDFEIEAVMYKDVDIYPTIDDEVAFDLSERCKVLIEQ